MPNKAATEKRVIAILDKVRPYIQMHGGDMQFLGFEKGTVTLRIMGACVGCSLADLTYNKMLGGLLKSEVPGVRKVVVES
ncbi:MAG: hypothetical protein RL681_581 [Candidatus Parcubacteria bacterium]|jgi:Fe-S cluster biogenesis protein NfuA